MQNIISLPLSGTYRLAYAAQRELAAADTEITSFSQLGELGFPIIDAKVPGNFELSLQAAGVIGDPFYGSNILELQKYENYHVFYTREFEYQPQPDCAPVLRFEGLDTVADVFLNGKKIGHTENMFIAHTLPADGIRAGKNELLIHIFPACLEARKYELTPQDVSMRYNFDQLSIRKAAHMYGWDIMPRAVSCGIWRDVFLDLVPRRYVRNAYFMTQSLSADHTSAQCELFFAFEIGDDPISGYSLRLTGSCADSQIDVSDVLWFTQGKIAFEVKNPKLWWPAGRGAQHLYDLVLTLYHDGQAVAEKRFRTGIRTAKLQYSATLDENFEGEFVFVINGEKTFIKGSNWVPADAYHSRDRERIPQMLDLWIEIGCNALRSWGGGVYEDDLFFDLCDEKGIIVWQDFAMGCAAYPQNRRMQELLREEAAAVVKKLRHHPSLCLWAGDNEVDYFMAYLYHTPPQTNVLTRKVLAEVTAQYDGTRTYLPSSPYVSPETYAKNDEHYLPEHHLWGPRDYFKSDFYTGAKAVFASEMGYHGCPSPASMRKFLRPENLWTDYKDNIDWLTHAASPEQKGPYSFRNNLMRSHVKTLWGIEKPESLERFAMASQISQAEAKKYFVERFRCKKWQRTGVIWWNIIDGWPQISDAIVDYYFTKKLAFSYLKRSQAEVCLMFDEPQNGELTLIAANDTRSDAALRYHVYDLTDGRTEVCRGAITAKADASSAVAQIPYDGKNRFYYIEWERDGQKAGNHFLAGKPAYDLDWYLERLRSVGYDCFEGFEKE